MQLNLVDLSRAVSHALRHEPWLYELELDDEGWANIESVMTAIQSERAEWRNVNEGDLARMIAESSKRRHEILGGKIRALYGHSIPGKLSKTSALPPAVLYHGTTPTALPNIRVTGLLPMGRQYVHLSVDEATAKDVGRRKAKTPVVLRIISNEAQANGVRFYIGNDKVWLADLVPPEFIRYESVDSTRTGVDE